MVLVQPSVKRTIPDFTLFPRNGQQLALFKFTKNGRETNKPIVALAILMIRKTIFDFKKSLIVLFVKSTKLYDIFCFNSISDMSKNLIVLLDGLVCSNAVKILGDNVIINTIIVILTT